MNVLLTSAGRRSYIVDYFKQCEGIDKVYASNSIYTIALKRADGYFLSPLIYDENYIPSIIDFCIKHDVKIVLSLFDIDLYILAQNEEEFKKNGINLILAPVDFVRICNDKWSTYKTLLELGILTPKTYLHVEDVVNAIKTGELSYPIIMKPRWGMASMDIFKVYNDDELRVLTERSKRDIFHSYLKYESSMTPEESIIYQEIQEGEEYGLDVFNDLNGNYVGTFPKQKVTMRSGETDLGRTAQPEPFIEVGKKLANYSHHKGILSVDCFKTDKGISVIEMNCRISGHYPLSHLAGINYPQQLVEWVEGKPTNKEYFKFTPGLFITKDLQPLVLDTEEDIKLTGKKIK